MKYIFHLNILDLIINSIIIPNSDKTIWEIFIYYNLIDKAKPSKIFQISLTIKYFNFN